MSELSSEWVAKAEADLAAARVLIRQRTRPLADQVCFLCQQSTEKYLKAFLAAQQREFPRVHNLLQLNDLCAAVDQEFDALGADLGQLDLYAVEIRYPGTTASSEDARASLAVARRVQHFVTQKLDALAGTQLV